MGGGITDLFEYVRPLGRIHLLSSFYLASSKWFHCKPLKGFGLLDTCAKLVVKTSVFRQWYNVIIIIIGGSQSTVG